MTQFEKQAAVLALRKMFAPDHWFCFCRFRELVAMCKVNVTKEEMLPFEVLHCVHYRDMPKGFRTELAGKVMEILSREPEMVLDFDSLLEKELRVLPTAEPKGLVKRLLGL